MGIDFGKTDSYAVAVGNMVDGFVFYGPFLSDQEAIAYGESAFAQEDWSLIQLLGT